MKLKWKERVKRLNYSYLSLMREIAISGDTTGLNLMGLDRQLMDKLAETENWVLESLAEIGVTLFKIQPEQIDRTLDLANTGQDQKAQALIMMGAVSKPAGEVHRGE